MEKPLEIILQDPYDLINDIRKARKKPEQISVAFVKHDAVCYDHEADKYAFVNTRLTEKDFEDSSLIDGLSIEIVSDGKEYVIRGSIDSKSVFPKQMGKTCEYQWQPEEGVSLSLAYVPQPFSKRVANSLLGKENKGQLKWSVEICRNNTKNIYTDLLKVAQYLEEAMTEQYLNTPQTAPLGEIHLAYHPKGKKTNMLFDPTRVELYDELNKECEQLLQDLNSVFCLKKEIEDVVKPLVPNNDFILSRSYNLVLDYDGGKVLFHRETLADGIWKAQGTFIGYTLDPIEEINRVYEQVTRLPGSINNEVKPFGPVIEE